MGILLPAGEMSLDHTNRLKDSGLLMIDTVAFRRARSRVCQRGAWRHLGEQRDALYLYPTEGACKVGELIGSHPLDARRAHVRVFARIEYTIYGVTFACKAGVVRRRAGRLHARGFWHLDVLSDVPLSCCLDRLAGFEESSCPGKRLFFELCLHVVEAPREVDITLEVPR